MEIDLDWISLPCIGKKEKKITFHITEKMARDTAYKWPFMKEYLTFSSSPCVLLKIAVSDPNVLCSLSHLILHLSLLRCVLAVGLQLDKDYPDRIHIGIQIKLRFVSEIWDPGRHGIQIPFLAHGSNNCLYTLHTLRLELQTLPNLNIALSP